MRNYIFTHVTSFTISPQFGHRIGSAFCLVALSLYLVTGVTFAESEGKSLTTVDQLSPTLTKKLTRGPQPITLTKVSSSPIAITDIAVSERYGYGISKDLWLNPIIDLFDPTQVTEFSANKDFTTDEIEIVDDLLYAAGHGKFRVFSLTEPVTPTLLAELHVGTWYPSDLKIYGDIAVTNDVLIFDISDPSAPAILGHIKTQFGSTVEVEDNYIYVMGSRYLEIIDITDPRKPTHTATLDLFQTHKGISMGKVGDHLVISANDARSTVLIVDVSDPSVPTIAERIENSALLRDIVFEGSISYILCKDYRTFTYRLCIYDFSDPLVPIRITDHELARAANALTIKNGYIYVAEGTQLTIFQLDNGATQPQPSPTQMPPISATATTPKRILLPTTTPTRREGLFADNPEETCTAVPRIVSDGYGNDVMTGWTDCP